MSQTGKIDVAAIVGDATANKPALIARFRLGMMKALQGKVYDSNCVGTKKLAKIVVKKGAKPYTGNFVAKGDVTYKPRTVTPQMYQRDLLVHPNEFRGTIFEGERAKGSNASNKSIPYATLHNQAVVDQLVHELVRDVLYHGKKQSDFVAFDAGDTYAVGDLVTFTQDSELRYWKCLATTSTGQSPETHPAKWEDVSASAICEGLGSKIAAAIVAGDIVPVTTGALTSTNAYDKAILVYRGLPEEVKAEPALYMFVSPNTKELIMDAYETAVKKNFAQTDNMDILPKTEGKVRIIADPSMIGSSRIICTTPNNIEVVSNGANPQNDIDVQPFDYKLKYMITGDIDINFRDAEAMSVNDQA